MRSPSTFTSNLCRTAALSALLVVVAALAVGCASTGTPRAGEPPVVGTVERGMASWYGGGFHGRRTASGERYDMNRLTAAHRTLPFGTLLEVRNLENGKVVRVRVNDRGPFKKNRVIDLSFGAAKEVEMVGPGTARVELRVLGTRATPEDVDPALFGDDRYTVQVGAFADPERAASLCQELRTTHPEAEVHADGIWHRVQLGVFNTRNLAEDLRDELIALGYSPVVVVAPSV
jgi:rare lipoprotein A